MGSRNCLQIGVDIRLTADKLYYLVNSEQEEYAVAEHNPRTASAYQAEFDFGFSNRLRTFFGAAGVTTSLRDNKASRLSIIQRVTIAAAAASIHASISIRIAFAKFVERLSSASSASSSERLLASNRNSSCGKGMGRSLSPEAGFRRHSAKLGESVTYGAGNARIILAGAE